MTLAALFIAHATNVDLSLQDQLLLLLIAMISSKGAASVTGAGLDRFMSECRSLTNFIGNSVATIVVSA